MSKESNDHIGVVNMAARQNMHIDVKASLMANLIHLDTGSLRYSLEPENSRLLAQLLIDAADYVEPPA